MYHTQLAQEDASFDEIFDLTAGWSVFSFFYNIYIYEVYINDGDYSSIRHLPSVIFFFFLQKLVFEGRQTFETLNNNGVLSRQKMGRTYTRFP